MGVRIRVCVQVKVRVAGTLASSTSSEAAPRLAEPAPWKRKRSPRASATRSVHCGLQRRMACCSGVAQREPLEEEQGEAA